MLVTGLTSLRQASSDRLRGSSSGYHPCGRPRQDAWTPALSLGNPRLRPKPTRCAQIRGKKLDDNREQTPTRCVATTCRVGGLMLLVSGNRASNPPGSPEDPCEMSPIAGNLPFSRSGRIGSWRPLAGGFSAETALAADPRASIDFRQDGHDTGVLRMARIPAKRNFAIADGFIARISQP